MSAIKITRKELRTSLNFYKVACQIAWPFLFNLFDGIHKRKIKAYTNIRTLLSVNEREYLFQLAKNAKEGTDIVEIGCFAGGSTYFLAKGAEVSGSYVYSIDPFTSCLNKQEIEGDNSRYLKNFHNKPSKQHVEETIKFHNLKHLVTLIEGFSQEIALQWDSSVGLLWIDGNHRQAYEDFYAWKRYLTTDAVVAFHDANYPKQGRQEVTESVKKIIQQENVYFDKLESIITIKPKC